MISIKKIAALGIFYATVVALAYSAICIGCFIFSAFMLSKGVVFSDSILRAYQKRYYWSTIKPWQSDSKCAEFDRELIYKPRLGKCAFNTPEFKSTLSFNENGRVSGHKTNDIGIAVIGDSFAMGWGVNDDETFAAILEEMIRRPVYNLAVSSYATNRELLRLERSGLVSKIDTVIIQYCGNDLNENAYGVQHALLWRVPASATSTTRSLFELMYTGLPLNRRLSVWIMAALKTPLLKAKDILSGESGDRRRVEDFASHYAALTRILSKFPWLESKRVIIFYADSPDLRYANFVRSENRSGLTFVDLSVGPKLHYALDLHLNKQGHRRIAEKLFRIVMSDARATNSGDVTIAGAQGQ